MSLKIIYGVTLLINIVLLTGCGPLPASGEVVEYEVVFEATWSQSTHPQDFPPGPHFSGLVGGTHNTNVTFWQEGELASLGIEQMAEVGSKTSLTNEVTASIDTGDAFSILSGGGISSSPGLVTLTFQVSDTHSLVTLVSMLAPSPDWFVGVSNLDLRNANGTWQGEVIVDLDPYDAGTDSGTTFTSGNDDMQPRDLITDISDSFPFTGTSPVGTFTFRLLTPPTAPALGQGALIVMAILMIGAASFVMSKRSGVASES